MKAKKKNKNNIIILVILFFSIGIGYAIINSSLNINIGLKVKKIKTIYFDDVRIVDGSVTATTPPIADKHYSTVNFSVNFSNVNDTYTFYIDMKNNKQTDSFMLNKILKSGLTEEQASIIDYNVYYENGDEIIINELFQSDTDSIKVEVKVKEGVTSIEPQSLNLTLELRYIFADNNAIFAPYYYLKDKSISDSSLDFSGTSGTGIYELTESKNDEFPVYFYRGSSNNKVIFNGKCWNVIRTTDTRGTKLIYAGVPSSSGACSNTTSSTTTTGSSTQYNETTNLISSVGYMYDDANQIELKTYNLADSHIVYASRKNYYHYSNSTYTFNKYYYTSDTLTSTKTDNTCSYKLNNTAEYSNSTLKNKWTNFDTSLKTVTTEILESNEDSCPTKYGKDYLNYYIFHAIYDGSSTSVTGKYYEYYYVTRENYDKNLYFSSEYTKNEDGTYSLIDAEIVPYLSWYDKTKSNYLGKYTCLNNSDTCEDIVYVKSNSIVGTIYATKAKIKFAKQVTYENGIYTLVDPIDDYGLNKDTIKDNYHYSCLTEEDTCEEVAYIIKYDDNYNDTLIYTSLNGIEPLQDVQFDFSTYFTNEKDSIAKQKVDEWFVNNMTNVQDKIEDTIYCNDRSISNEYYGNTEFLLVDNIEFGGYNRMSTYKPSVICPLERDSFTMSPDLGNGKLIYPVGLITIDEQRLVLGAIQGNGYDYYTMTPVKYVFDTLSSYMYEVYGTNKYEQKTTSSYYIRPVISLKYGVKFYGGDGSSTYPYKVYGDS